MICAMEATTTRMPTEPEEGPDEELSEQVTPLELFFDLVFVFAFTQVTGLMAAHPTWEGLGQGLLVLAAVWWAWAGYAWLTNALHSDDGIARVGLLSAMAAMLIAALAVPQAFGDDSVVFGFAYLAVRAIHIVVYARGVEDTDIRGAILGLAPGLLAAPALIVIAGFLDGGAAAGLWIVALIIDYGTPYVQDMSGFSVAPDALSRALRADRDHRPRRVDRRHRHRPRLHRAHRRRGRRRDRGSGDRRVPVVGVLRRRRAGRRTALRGAGPARAHAGRAATATGSCICC